MFAGYQQEENTLEKLDEERIEEVEDIQTVKMMMVEKETGEEIEAGIVEEVGEEQMKTEEVKAGIEEVEE